MQRLFILLLLMTGLGACSGTSIWAPDDVVARASFPHNGPSTIRLLTVISNSSNAGAHSALFINGEERIAFDPSGTWTHPYAPERNDVFYGMNPAVTAHYEDYHARVTFRVVTHEVQVSREVAARATAAVEQYGAVGNAYCTNSITDVLRTLPGFETIPRTFFPKTAMAAFAALPGVEERVVRDGSPDHNKDMLELENVLAYHAPA